MLVFIKKQSTTVQVWMQTTHAGEKAGKLFWRAHVHCELIAQGRSGHELQEVGTSREIQSQKGMFCLSCGNFSVYQELMCTPNPNERNVSGSNVTFFTGIISEEIQVKKDRGELAASQLAGAGTFSFSPINWVQSYPLFSTMGGKGTCSSSPSTPCTLQTLKNRRGVACRRNRASQMGYRHFCRDYKCSKLLSKPRSWVHVM